jgi:radical SAM superfamily enzyme YgiQ (UPF0313 family)
LVVLIYPPVAKTCEPPAGIARLSGMLGKCGIEHRLLDSNLEGLLHLLRMPVPPGRKEDVWTRRALRNREHNLASMRDPALYHHIDRYKRAVRDISRVLSKVSPSEMTVGLANYEHSGLSPLRSGDLLAAAERPDLNPFYGYFRSRIGGLLREKEPSAVGISVNYLSQALSAFSVAGFIRRELPGLKIILGGGLITSWMKNLGGKNPFAGLADHLVSGPGEQQLLSLLRPDATVEGMPPPDYDALSSNLYLSPGFVLPYSASAGCYWSRCEFCPEKSEGNPYLPVPAQQVLSDLKALAEKTSPALIHLLDNALSPALLSLLSAHGPNVPWYGFARIDQHLADPDFCTALRRAGCVMLKLGIESGDQVVLDALQKGINIDTASVVLRNLKRAGIATYVYLLFGTPPESEAGARKTLEFTVRHSDFISFLNLAIFNMPVCDQHFRGIAKRRFYEGDLSLYTDFTHPHGWDRKRVRMFLENEFKRHPAISSILKNDPPVFTSNHAPFFAMREITCRSGNS